MSKSRFVLAAFILTLCFTPKIVASGWSVDIESGAAFNGYNDVRIPGNTGTAISLTEDLDADAAAFIRVRLTKSLGERQRLSVLVAPLRITASMWRTTPSATSPPGAAHPWSTWRARNCPD